MTGGPARVDAPVPADATPALARVVGWLGGPPRVRVRYPGVWLGDRVWATHGHYLDRHLLPEGGYGVTRGLLGRVPRDGTTPAAYERSTSSLAGLERAMSRAPRPVTTAFDDIAEVARAATMPRLSRRVLRRRLAPVASVLLGLQMRRASLPALAHVVHRLGVDAEHVIFGHVHRLGPLPGDDLRRWVGPAGRPLMANTGAWVYESILVDHARPPHPYWPGGAIVIAGDGVPRAVRLLDHVDAATLQPPQTRAGRRPSST